MREGRLARTKSDNSGGVLLILPILLTLVIAPGRGLQLQCNNLGGPKPNGHAFFAQATLAMSLRTLIALLRALDSLDTLNGFLPDPGISPVAMMLREDPTPYRVTPMGTTQYPTKYASKPRKKPAPTPWKWGDEK